MVKSYRDLIVWQKAMEFARMVYRLQKALPKEEVYGLGDQIRRAVVSIPSNIAEGYGRESKSDFMHFLVIARGSLCEVETQLDLAQSLGYLSVPDEIWCLAGEIGRMLNGFISKLRPQPTTGTKTNNRN